LGNYDKSQALVIDPLIYSTYIGGSNYDFGYGIAVDGSGNAYVTGWTASPNFPVTAGAYQTTNGGNEDVFVTKLCLVGIILTSGVGSDDQTVCMNSSITPITYSSSGATGATFSGLPAGVTGTFSNSIIISGAPTETGIFNYTVTLEGGGCPLSVQGTITVNAPTVIAMASPSAICYGESTTLTVGGGVSYSWDHGLGGGSSHTVTPTSTTTYAVTGTDGNGCSNTASVTVTVQPLPEISIDGDTEVCEGEEINLIADGAASYTWILSNGLTIGQGYAHINLQSTNMQVCGR